MAADEFIWPVDKGATCEYTQAVVADSFGEGYEQVTAQGINSIIEHWRVTLGCRGPEEAAAFEAFYRAKGQVTTFTWTAPVLNAVQKSYRFKSAPKRTVQDGCEQWTCELKEVP